MAEAQLSKYNITLAPVDGEVSDHELLLMMVKDIKEMKADIVQLKTDVNQLKTDIVVINARLDNLVVKNNLIE